jgi:K(+)-stimulated pyrophosphate-energized sodium pump
LGALVLFAAYTNDLKFFARQCGRRTLPVFRRRGVDSRSLSNPYVVAGLIFGGLIPYLFGGMSMTAVGRAGGAWWKRFAGSSRPIRASWKARRKPDYARAVDMLTKAAIKEMIVPSLLPVLSPLLSISACC